MNPYVARDTQRRYAGKPSRIQGFPWQVTQRDYFDIPREREQAMGVLDGTMRFSHTDMQRIIARLMLGE